MSERFTASVQWPTSGYRSRSIGAKRFGTFQRIEWVYRRRRTWEGGSIGEDERNNDRVFADRRRRRIALIAATVPFGLSALTNYELGGFWGR
jgi:hypothetical protein